MRRKRTGIALVLGTADGVWQEAAQAQGLRAFDGVVACNEMVAYWPGQLDAAVTLHPEKLPGWLAKREKAGLPPPKKTVVHAEWQDWYRHAVLGDELPFVPDITTPYRFKGQTDSGSSGLFALKVALVDLGFAKAVCCGIPMTRESGHFGMNVYMPWPGATRHRAGWEQAMPVIAKRARSMGGWTAQLLGEPDAAFLL